MASSRRPRPEAGRRAAVGLADLLRALSALQLRDPAHAAAAAHCLGFTGIDMNPAMAPRGAASQQHRRPRPEERQSPRTGLTAAVPPAPEEPEAPPPLPGRVVASALDDLKSAAEPAPGWFQAAQQQAAQRRAEAAARGDAGDAVPAGEPPRPAPPPRAPLLPVRTASAVLRASVATRRPGADPDIGRILQSLLAGALPDPLPMLPEAALHRGVQLLLDVSPAMTPWFADLRQLAGALSGYVGRALCEVYRFDHAPEQARPAGRGGASRARWRPRRARPVLLASALDLGPRDTMAPAPDRERWPRFAEIVRRAGVPLVCLTPVGPERWPPTLARRLSLVHWDPATRAEAVRRLVGPGHEVLD